MFIGVKLILEVKFLRNQDLVTKTVYEKVNSNAILRGRDSS